MRYLVPVLLLAFTACSEDKPTEPPEPPAPVLDTKANEIKNGTWASADYIVADRKWKLLSISEEGLRVSWVLDFTSSSDKVVRVEIAKLTFEDKDGFELSKIEFPFSEEDFRMNPSSSVTRTGTSVLKIYDVDTANSITNMGIWAGFTEL
tara:strand:- start:631 stop:1080 length:450 start_codon:yes stop_codon:yes gene_type:complete